jgi:hypothetical protein
MFIRPNNPIYWLAAILLIFVAFHKFNTQKNNRPQDQKPELSEIELDMSEKSLLNSINEIAEILKKEKVNTDVLLEEVKNIKKDSTRFRISHVSFPEKINQIGLCENGYVFDISVFDENANLLSKNTNINLSKFGSEKDFYNTLNEVFTLSAVGQKIEIFANLSSDFPKFLLGKKALAPNQSVLAMLTVKQITGKVNFDPKSISSFLISEEKAKRKPKPKFFCKDEIKINFSIYDSKGKILKKDIDQNFKLGKSVTGKDLILEYLALTSKDDKIDAIVPAKYFSEDKSLETVIIKGIISKKDV